MKKPRDLSNIMTELDRQFEEDESPRLSIDLDWVSFVAKSSETIATEQGIPLGTVLGQILLAGAAVGGSQLRWCRPGKEENPRYGRPSVTFLVSDEEFPSWFEHRIRPLIDWNEKARRWAESHVTAAPSSRELARRQAAARALGCEIPQAGQAAGGHLGSNASTMDPEFLIEVASRITKPPVKPNKYGRDRLVILNGTPAYHALLRTTGQGPVLKRAAVGDGPGLRTTLHGWASSKAFRKLARERCPAETRCFGWLLPAGRLPIGETRIEGGVRHFLGVFEHVLELRHNGLKEVFQPHPEVVRILDNADSGWSPPSWCADEPLRGMLRMDEELAWQLLAAMRVMSRRVEREPSEVGPIVDAGVSLALWIRAAHCREIRLLFAGPPCDPGETLSCRIADKLRLGVQSPRELVRCFHKVRTEEVRTVLQRMQTEGWVARIGKDQWQLDLPPLPKLSANWSEISNWRFLRPSG